MGVTVTDTRFYNRWTGTGGGGTSYPNQPVTSRMDVEIDFYIAWNLTDARLKFTTGVQTIEMLNDYDTRTFTDEGFKVGDTITVVDSTTNDGDYTITAISEDGRTLTVAEALNSETVESVSIHGVTPVDTIDLSYNMIGNDEAVTYLSKVDTTYRQRITATGVDATDTLHAVSFYVKSKSRGWVNFKLADETTGECDGIEIIGAGVTDYKQAFTITKRFYITPFFTIDQLDNFENNIPPDYYNYGSSLKYVGQIAARFSPDTSVPDHVGTFESDNGNGGWYDEANFGSRPEYYFQSIAYETGGETVDNLSVTDPTVVTIVVKSRSGLFTATTTKVLLSFHLCPDSPDDYQNTPDETMLDNFNFDTVVSLTGAAAAAGMQYGTDRELLSNCTFTRNDAETITIVATVTPNAWLIAYWQTKDDGNRKYAFGFSSDDVTVTETKATKSNVVLCDFNSAFWDKQDTTLFEFNGSGIYCYEYPDTGVYGVGDINGFEGDWWMVKIPFLIDKQSDADGNTPTLKTVKLQVLAVKTGYDDFVLQEKVVQCDSIRKLDGVQQIEIEDDQGLISYDNDPRNIFALLRDDTEDTATQAAFYLQCGIMLRYEWWQSAFDAQVLSENGTNTTPDISKFIRNITQQWSNYSGVNGVSLVLRFTAVVTDNDGNDTEFYSDADITVNTSDQIIWTGASGTPVQSITYYDPDTLELINCLQRNGRTRVVVSFSGSDYANTADASGYYGCMLAVTTSGGSIFTQRFASTETDSEEDSPWSATDVAPSAASSYSNGNLRINIYETLGVITSIVVEGYFDSTYLGESDEMVLILPRLGQKYIST